jgi:hypothetical protein
MTRHADQTKCWPSPVLLAAFAVLALLVGTDPAAAGQVGPLAGACMQPVFTAAGGSTLNCNAKEVNIAVATPTAVNGIACDPTKEPPDPTACTCVDGSLNSITIDVTYNLSGGGAQKTRFDLGAYFDVSGDGTNGARTGECIHATLQPGDDGYYSSPEDQVGDTCGDIDTANNNLTTTIELTGVKCEKAPGTDKVALPYSLSWTVPGAANVLCTSPPVDNGDGTITTQALPSSPSKCKCDDNFFIDVTVTPPPTGSGLKCAVGALTGCTTVRYKVEVNAVAGGSDTSVTVESITDNTVDPTSTPPGALIAGFGDITTTHGNATTNLSVVATTCTKGATATTPYSCTFDGVLCGAPGNHTNQITASLKGHPSNQTSTFPDDPTDTNNGPTEGRVTIGVNNISGSGSNICPTTP